MAVETMTARERIEAAINLEATDRVPVSPFMVYHPCRVAGISVRDYIYDPAKNDAAWRRTFERYGGFDMIAGPIPVNFPRAPFYRFKLPGRDLPEDAVPQFVSGELMTADEYDIVIEGGLAAILPTLIERVRGKPVDKGPPRSRDRARKRPSGRLTREKRPFIQGWLERGIPVMIGGATNLPFEELCNLRSFEELAIDLYHRPKQVQTACAAIIHDLVERALTMVRITEVPQVFVVGTRQSATFISPQQFEQFVWPSTQALVEQLVAAGCIVFLHLDGDCTPMLEYLRALPTKKCVLQLENTDIFRAKEIVGDRICLMGNVKSTLLRLGTPQEIQAICRKLIDEVGKDGGFILSSGCEVPIDARPENVQAMIDTAKTS
ncbi:MAG: uroporphyrinogen decarboxylase family protein [Anaerolineae bacterium]